MAKATRDWAWKRLLGQSANPKERVLNYRKPDYMENAQGQMVRYHHPHPITPAIERFLALTERVEIGDDTCVVWQGGATFRVDDATITTPARFYWEAVLGEKLQDGELLLKACKTPRCVKHKRLYVT